MHVNKKGVKLVDFSVYEDGERTYLSLDELVELQEQGYILEIRLIKPAVIKNLSLTVELDEETVEEK